MSFKEHSDFVPPQSKEAKIWRYMDLTKLLSILCEKSLFFPSITTLSNDDPFEGYYTNADLEFEETISKKLERGKAEKSGSKEELKYKATLQLRKIKRTIVKKSRDLTFVNCWHLKNYESAAMWNQYLSNHEGVAIQSTYDRLKSSFNVENEFDIYIGKVKYIDYQKDNIPMGTTTLTPFMFKRRSFEYEDELRALIYEPDLDKKRFIEMTEKPISEIIKPENIQKSEKLNLPGISVSVDVSTLIENIYVSPNAPSWVVELIQTLIKRLEYDKNIIQSNLASKPIY